MNTDTIIQYLEIFALTAFGLFFLTLSSILIYVFFILKYIKKSVYLIVSDLLKITRFVDTETQILSSLVKNKINSINLEKILFGSTILGNIITGIKNNFSSKKSDSSPNKNN